MTKRIGNMVVIAPEADAICEMCGKKDELRPYGSNGERICFDCGMKDEKTTNKMMEIKLFGVGDGGMKQSAN